MSEGKSGHDESSADDIGPNIQNIKQMLDRLVFKSDKPVVVAINGGWGEGKTYFWKNEVVKSYDTDNSGYVSVFGASSIQEIRQKVIAEAILKSRVGKGVSGLDIIDTVSNVLKQSAGGLLAKLSQKIGVPDALSTRLLEETVIKKNWILCIDDVERLPESILFDELLGYINELRDDRYIKVVLIYNEDAIRPNSRYIFDNLQEKIVDRTLRFVPDMKTILKMVFGGVKDVIDTSEQFDTLVRRCNTIGIKNIRLLGRLKIYYQEVVSLLPEESDADFKANVLHSLLLFIFIRYSRKENTSLTLEFLNGYSWLVYDSDDKEYPEDIKRASKFLSDYNYMFTDDIDSVLIDFIANDILNDRKLLSEYEKYLQHRSKGQLEHDFRKIWTKYYRGSLTSDPNQFCDELILATKKYIHYIDLGNFDGVLNVLTELDRSEDADKLLLEMKEKRYESFAQYEGFPGHPLSHQGLIDAVEKAKSLADIDNRTIQEVLNDIGGESLIQSRERRRLAEFTANDFFDYFMSTESEHLLGDLHQLGHIASKLTNPDPNEIKIQRNVREAARLIANISSFNEFRMLKLNLIDKDE